MRTWQSTILILIITVLLREGKRGRGRGEEREWERERGGGEERKIREDALSTEIYDITFTSNLHTTRDNKRTLATEYRLQCRCDYAPRIKAVIFYVDTMKKYDAF